MTTPSYFLAFATIAAVAASTLAPANAAVFGPRHFVRNSHHFVFATRPGVYPCRRGIVYVCQ
jgi:hypothetical protein